MRLLLGMMVGAVALAGVVGACGNSEEEVVQQAATLTPSPDTSASPAPSTPPAPSPTPAVTPEDTFSYTDPTYGYSFDYPETWYLSPPKDGQPILYSYDPATVPPEDAGRPVPADKLKLEFVVLGNPQGLSLVDWIEQSRQSGGPVEVTSRSTVTIDSRPGIAETVNLAEGSAIQYFFTAGSNVYVISKYPPDSLLSKEFDGVMASFRF